tara:strand:- start:17 stop:397 length:381 start_codon:yes stop_codon:yes gene_type:complete
MTQDFQDIALQLFVNSPFVGFLLYQWWDSRKLYREQRIEMKEIRKEAKEEELKLRERFDAVIKSLNEDKDQLVLSLERRIQALEKRFESVERSVKKLFATIQELRGVKDKLEKIEMKEELRKELCS